MTTWWEKHRDAVVILGVVFLCVLVPLGAILVKSTHDRARAANACRDAGRETFSVQGNILCRDPATGQLYLPLRP